MPDEKKKKTSQKHMDLLIELEFNMGLAKGQQENLIIQQNKRIAWVLYSTI